MTTVTSETTPRYSIVTEKDTFPIQPKDIPSKGWDHLWNAFDNNETEISAAYILLMCQERGNWAPFTFEEINTFYNEKRKTPCHFTFNRLIEPGLHYGMPGERHLAGGGWIVERDGKYFLTDDFIQRVSQSVQKYSSPVVR